MIGKVISGSVNKGVRAVLSNEENIELYPVGSLIAIKGVTKTYLGLITDAGIDSESNLVNKLTNLSISNELREVIVKNLGSLIKRQWIEIALIAQKEGDSVSKASTMPSFNSDLINVDNEVINSFFSRSDRRVKWPLGIPKAVGKALSPIPIDVSKLIELSFGIYGKSGTGKTFLGNLIASYITMYNIIEKPEKRIKLLIFDMHSEYALELKDNLGRPIADGVGKTFKDYFKAYTPDEELARSRGIEFLKIDYSELTTDDLRLIANIFGVSQTFLIQLDNFSKVLREDIKLGDLWVWGLLIDELSEKELMRSVEGRRILHEVLSRSGSSSVRALQARIEERIKSAYGPSALTTYRSQRVKLKRLLKYPYTYSGSTFKNIVNELLDPEGPSVIISLGRFEKEMPLYMVIANIVARRLRSKVMEYVERGEDIPVKVLIFLEEAHNFLGKDTYYLSPFGDIARELRKRGITLCVIDQKPSELDPNVITMIWTNFIFTLTDERDIEKSLIGAPHPHLLKKIVPILDRQEVLVYGEGVNFPVTVKVINYMDMVKELKGYLQNLLEKRKKLEELYEESGLL